MIKAVIFDLDGLMVDSTPLQQEATQKFLEKYGKFHFAAHVGREGMRIIDIISDYKDIYNLPGSIEDLYRERQEIYFNLAKGKLKIFADLLPLLQKLKDKGLKLAIATSGDREYIRVLFTKFPSLQKYFSVIVTSEDVIHGKPHPEVYIKTAAKLGEEVNLCVVLEDSMHGIASAKAAGMQTICIPNRHIPDADYSQADKIFATLEEVHKAIN